MPNLTATGKMRSFVLFLFLSLVSTFSSQVILDWEVYHPVNKTWLPFGKCGTVQEWLWHNAELPDPFYGENEAQYQWIEDHEWHFRSKFFLIGRVVSGRFDEVSDIPRGKFCAYFKALDATS